MYIQFSLLSMIFQTCLRFEKRGKIQLDEITKKAVRVSFLQVTRMVERGAGRGKGPRSLEKGPIRRFDGLQGSYSSLQSKSPSKGPLST